MPRATADARPIFTFYADSPFYDRGESHVEMLGGIVRQLVEQPWEWLQDNSGRIILLVATIIIAAVVVKVVSKGLRIALDKSNIPSASIFVNIVRVLIWVIAISLILQPVFGINPTTLMTALGVGGIAVSLGLKDTIANIVSGFGLMLGKVLKPGDLVTIQGVSGTVKDVTWRHTIVMDRSGVEMWVPNSVLNTAALEKLPPAAEAMATIPFTARGGKRLDTQAISSTGFRLMAWRDRFWCSPNLEYCCPRCRIGLRGLLPMKGFWCRTQLAQRASQHSNPKVLDDGTAITRVRQSPCHTPGNAHRYR